MPSSILFVHSYFLRLDGKQWKSQKPYPPLGTLYAMAVLRRAGHSVSLSDPMFEEGPQYLEPVLRRLQPRILVIYDDGFNYLTKMCLGNMQKAAFAMIAMAKREGCSVIVCSSDASDHRERYLKAGADCIILGEGERTLAEVVAKLSAGERLDDVRGLAYIDGGELRQSPDREVLRQLDELPDPAWDLIDLQPYERAWRGSHGFWSLNLVTTRGCPYRCNWCAKPIYGNRYHSHSPERIAAQMTLLRERYRPDHIWFCDDIFGLKPGWVKRFATVVGNRGWRIPYTIQSRVDLLLEPQAVDWLRQSGLAKAWVGAESGSQRILDAMEKGTRVEQIHAATKLLQSKGIAVAFFLQFGYLGEEKQDIEATIRLVGELLPDEIGISISYPLPGTKFYRRVRDEMREKTNWNDSDDLAMLYRGTFSPSFYRLLHRYVHFRFALYRGKDALWRIISRPRSMDRGVLRAVFKSILLLPATWLAGVQLKRLEGRK